MVRWRQSVRACASAGQRAGPRPQQGTSTGRPRCTWAHGQPYYCWGVVCSHAPPVGLPAVCEGLCCCMEAPGSPVHLWGPPLCSSAPPQHLGGHLVSVMAPGSPSALIYPQSRPEAPPQLQGGPSVPSPPPGAPLVLAPPWPLAGGGWSPSSRQSGRWTSGSPQSAPAAF